MICAKVPLVRNGCLGRPILCGWPWLCPCETNLTFNRAGTAVSHLLLIRNLLNLGALTVLTGVSLISVTSVSRESLVAYFQLALDPRRMW